MFNGHNTRYRQNGHNRHDGQNMSDFLYKMGQLTKLFCFFSKNVLNVDAARGTRLENHVLLTERA
jgi:hypothetical protein